MQSMRLQWRPHWGLGPAFGKTVREAILFLSVLLLLPEAQAQEWAKKMFDHTSVDLGTVARGAKVEHVFRIENIYVEDVHIASVRSNCGCTIPNLEKRLLKTYEKVPLVIQIDTKNFSGRKDVTITVQFDQPFSAEVLVHVSVLIRTDVVFQPGSVQLGTVPQGQTEEQKLSVVYAGRPNWKILRVESPKPYLETKWTEVSRSADPVLGATKVCYDLVVRLKPEAPPGRILEQLLVITDDPNPKNAQIPLTVEGTVVPPVSVNPSPLSMGPVVAGTTVSKPLVVQARQPFRILAIQCDCPAFQAKKPAETKPIHVIQVQFTASATPGKVSGTLRIQTDLSESPEVEVKVEALVLPPS